MHVGVLYRTIFRRDYPTGGVYPSLWPWRCTLMAASVFHLPGPRFNNIYLTHSDPGSVDPDINLLTYIWSVDDGFATAYLIWTINPDPSDRDMKYEWLFVDTAVPGHLLLRAHGPAMDADYGYGNFNRIWPNTDIFREATGGFTLAGPEDNYAFQTRADVWEDLPEDERKPPFNHPASSMSIRTLLGAKAAPLLPNVH